jgi:hypothetical protein
MCFERCFSDENRIAIYASGSLCLTSDFFVECSSLSTADCVWTAAFVRGVVADGMAWFALTHRRYLIFSRS